MFEEIKARIRKQDRFESEKLAPSTLSIFEYVLEIKAGLNTEQDQAKQLQEMLTKEMRAQKTVTVQGQTHCPFCSSFLKQAEKPQSLITME